MSLNMEVFHAINGLAYKNAALDSFMVFCSKYLPYIFALTIIIVFVLGIVKGNIEYRKMAVSTVVFTIINLIISFIIGMFYYSPRPFVHNKVNLLYYHAADTSFPSDHATASMSIALGFGMFDKILGWIFVILSVLIGISRVYVGQHYPTDVIGAYIIVIITGFIYNKFLKSFVVDLYEKIENKIFGRQEILQ